MIFVEMDKELRGWMASELGRWRHDGELVSKVWTRRLVEIYDLLEACGWNSRKASFMNLLHQCQLVVNVYKHGHGNSLHELKADYPQYLTSKTEEELYLDIDFLDHAQLHVEMHQLIAFSNGIVDFWESIPERLFLDYTADFPVWFVKAWNHDTSE